MNLFEKLFCTHRHSIEDHPMCFSQGNVDLAKAERLAKENGIPWYQMPEYRIGYIDIESDGLKTDFSTMLSWCIKEKDGPIVFDRIFRIELFDGTCDERLVYSLVQEMKNYKILVGYYSTGFDLPFIRTKALHYGIPFPEYGSIYHFDLFYTVKSKLLLSRKSLDNVCDYLGIEGKTPLDKDVWRKGKYGDEESIQKIVEHNVGDVQITEQLHDKLSPFRKWIKTSI